MYAVVKTGGKQYRVAQGDTIRVEKLDGQSGQSITLNDVLMVVDGDAIKLGRPMVQGATVSAQILAQDLDSKVIVYKYKRRKRFRRKNGHRQPFTALQITGISA